jgi:hypothetical protein
MRITEIEEEELRAYYDTANEEDTDEAWHDVRNYYNQLGKKYGFDPRRVMINTKGEVTKISEHTIYVVYSVKTGVPIQSYYSKGKALEHSMDDEDLLVQEINLS